MSKRNTLLESIAKTICDYREGEIPTPTAAHVDEWIRQFNDAVQVSMLTELDYVLKRTYISQTNVKEFLSGLVKNKKLAGDNPRGFWKNVEFLDIQQGGSSQHDMLQMFDQVLQEKCNLSIKDCGATDDTFVYLDDAVFTGNRVLGDLKKWIRDKAPSKAHVHVIVMAYHRSGQWYADKEFKKTLGELGKDIKISWWRCLEIENRKKYKDTSNVLWPAKIPADTIVIEYVDMLKGAGYPPELRTPVYEDSSSFFSSEKGRTLLEQELLTVGAKIKSNCPLLGETQRPLGHSTLKTLGFGALIVTFRNCPNNAPLAFWVGDPWYPLFPRKTN